MCKFQFDRRNDVEEEIVTVIEGVDTIIHGT